MRCKTIYLLAFFAGFYCDAQPLQYTSFTVADGLPSNFVYRCIEDDKGFLWIATDAGIARFDGKYFQTFSSQEGLPDNEVLAVIKEKNGRIWVNCFKQRPAFFDEVQNRFINAKEDSNLAQLPEGTSIMYSFPLKGGGVQFINEKGSFVLKNKKLTAYYVGESGLNFLIREYKDGTHLKYTRSLINSKINQYNTKLYQIRDGHYQDSIELKVDDLNGIFIPALDDGKFYIMNSMDGTCSVLSDIGINPIRFKLDLLRLPERAYIYAFSPSSIYFMGISGKIHIYNKNTLQAELSLSGNYLPNSFFNDTRGNYWVSTVDKGLLFYKNNQFTCVEMPEDFERTNFLSIARQADGTLLAGNYYGEIIQSHKKRVTVKSLFGGVQVARLRKILISQKNVYAFSENGINVNFTHLLRNTALNQPYLAKTAVTYNDSIIILGLFYGMQKLNTRTNEINYLKVGKRITCLGKGLDGSIYFGSTDGLYKYDYARDSAYSLSINNELLSERITAITTTEDSLLWVATSGSGLLVLKNDKLIRHLTEKDGLINNAGRSLVSGKPAQVWLGTTQGISVIEYKLQQEKLDFSIQTLSVKDGLTHNVINEMLFDKDTIFAATGDGISIIPANFSAVNFNIPVYLTSIKINQKDIKIASSYDLDRNQKNIQMRFAGVELGGHFKKFQYQLDENENWTDLPSNILTVQLSSGKHKLQVRAVDVNGNPGKSILSLHFNIATPFWETLWFWVLMTIAIQGLVLFFIIKHYKRKREVKLQREITKVQIASLEQQAFTSLMNPHFMFNALNSVQHYINVQDRQNANRYLSDFASLIRKNFEGAQRSFVQLEEEIENLKIYLRLEKMRFNDRIFYDIITDASIELEDWMIPSMIIQPLIENALLHGIMPSTIEGKISIELKQQEDYLLITITDNGIGIANSLALKTNNKHKSRGVELINRRIEALNYLSSKRIFITMEAPFSNKLNPGNRITLSIPSGLYQAWLKANQS